MNKILLGLTTLILLNFSAMAYNYTVFSKIGEKVAYNLPGHIQDLLRNVRIEKITKNEAHEGLIFTMITEEMFSKNNINSRFKYIIKVYGEDYEDEIQLSGLSYGRPVFMTGPKAGVVHNVKVLIEKAEDYSGKVRLSRGIPLYLSSPVSIEVK